MFAYPADLATVTGGYAYDRRIIAELQDQGWQVVLLSLGEGFPHPNAATIAQARQLLSKISPNIPVVIDGLALGSMPQVISEVSEKNPVIALIHHPLAFELGLSNSQIDRLKESETQALSYARHVIVNSSTTAEHLIKYFSVPPDSIDTVVPGTDPVVIHPPFVSERPKQGETLQLLSVGTIIPRKGFDRLIEALSTLKELPWQLTIVGDPSRHENCATLLYQQIADEGLDQRINVLGMVPDAHLQALYQQADIFVLASHFEGFGMAYAEALAHGLPIIGTTGGAIAKTVPPEAARLAIPGDVPSLRQALNQLIQDGALRSQMAKGAMAYAKHQVTWPQAGKLFAKVLTRYIA